MIHGNVTNEFETRQAIEGIAGAIEERQRALGLTTVELARRSGLDRLTIRRTREAGNDPKLSTVVAMAMAVGAQVGVESTVVENGYGQESTLVHRGLAWNRLNKTEKARDIDRERALARNWETANISPAWTSPMLLALLGKCTQDQASAAATVVQWLGTEIGFEFLKTALKDAGYDIVDTRRNK